MIPLAESSDYQPAPASLVPPPSPESVTAADLPPQLGIRFREIMSGSVSDPAGGPEEAFAFDLDLVIPSLAGFLSASPHLTLVAGGVVHWKGVGVSVYPTGQVELFGNRDATHKHKYFDFQFEFDLPGVGAATARATKDLFDDAGFDIIDDLSHVTIQVSGAGGTWRRAGRLAVHGAEFLEQIRSIMVTGVPAPTPQETARARAAFFGFLNRQLGEVYAGFPAIFRDAFGLSVEEWRTLELAMRIFLPDPLPADGPTFFDVRDELDRFVAHATSRQVDALRDWLQLIGMLLPMFTVPVAQLRSMIQAELAHQPPRAGLLRTVLDQLHSLVVLPYYAQERADRLVGYRRPLNAAKPGA